MTNHKAALALLLSATLLGACGAGSDHTSSPAGRVERARGGWLGGDKDLNWDDSASYADGPERMGGPEMTSTELAASPAKAGVAADESLPIEPGDGLVPPDQRQGPGLQAGSVDDNEAFADYLRYRDD